MCMRHMKAHCPAQSFHNKFVHDTRCCENAIGAAHWRLCFMRVFLGGALWHHGQKPAQCRVVLSVLRLVKQKVAAISGELLRKWLATTRQMLRPTSQK